MTIEVSFDCKLVVCRKEQILRLGLRFCLLSKSSADLALLATKRTALSRGHFSGPNHQISETVD